MTDRLGVHLSGDLAERVRVESAARGVAATWFVQRLVLEGLERLVPVEEFSLVRRDG